MKTFILTLACVFGIFAGAECKGAGTYKLYSFNNKVYLLNTEYGNVHQYGSWTWDGENYHEGFSAVVLCLRNRLGSISSL